MNLRLVWLGLVIVLPAISGATAPSQVTTFDARSYRHIDVRDPAQARRAWDALHLLAALQGLANRDAPRFYVLFAQDFQVDTDQFWLDWFRGEDGWLGSARLQPVADIDAALAALRPHYTGLVVYDPKVPATACVASTAAGCERLLPVRYDPAPESLFTRCARTLDLPIALWLVHPDGSSKFTGSGQIPDSAKPSSGSAKIDAYRWAAARYLETGRCDPRFAAYYMDADWLRRPGHAPADNHTLPNHDYFIAHRAFFFDLSPWGDEAPVDDPEQSVGLDRRMLLDLLRAFHDGTRGGITKIGGFPPWPFKYTTHGGAGGHKPVPTEWEFTRLISQFNAYHEADAASHGAMANASFFQHYPLTPPCRQPNPIPSRAQWQARGFVTPDGRVASKFFVGHYVGDYDAPSWLYKAVPAFFRDPARGQVPLGWAFDPNLADRAPQALAYAYRHATTNDFFIAGDSGAGYLNPRALTVRPDSGLPSGLAAWQAHCQRAYGDWGMTITGFALDGSAGASTATEFLAYKSFSPDGIGTHFEPQPRLIAGIPTCPEKDLPDGAAEAAALIARRAEARGAGPGFLWARSILKPPRWYAEVSALLRERHPDLAIEVVDPYTFFGLIRMACDPGNGGAARATEGAF